MADESAASREMASAVVTIEGKHFLLKCRVTVPTGPVQVSDLLPLARALSDAIVRETSKTVERTGDKISCAMGCGACCRNLVPVPEVEARRIREIVEKLPEPMRSEIHVRFTEARLRLERAGLLVKLCAVDRLTQEDYTSLIGSYFQQGIPCPFLEDESCSIYPERPIGCREYLVTSPPEYCKRLGSEGVRKVQMPLRLFNAVARWQVAPYEYSLDRWVPLILALEWAEAHPNDPAPKPGLELLRELLAHLKGQGKQDDL